MTWLTKEAFYCNGCRKVVTKENQRKNYLKRRDQGGEGR